MLQIYLDGTNATLPSRFEDSECSENQATGRRSKGGCISLHNVEEFVVAGSSELSDNSADDQGGAIYVGDRTKLVVKGSRLIRGNAARLGGAIVSSSRRA